MFAFHVQHFTKELVRFGAVHWAAVLPSLSEERLADMHAEKVEQAREARQRGLDSVTKQACHW